MSKLPIQLLSGIIVLVVYTFAILILYFLGEMATNSKLANKPKIVSELPEYPHISVFIDPTTKCEYLVSDTGTIIPRLTEHGLHKGCTSIQL